MLTFTLEARWIFEGSPDDRFARWFNHGNPVPWNTIEFRTDIYWLIPGAVDMGIKFRGEGKSLEIKGRKSVVGTKCFSPTATGVMDRWIKWSYDVVQTEEWVEKALCFTPQKIRVKKQRFQRKFNLAKNKEAVEIGLSEYVERGAYAELVRLAVGGADYWSIAFEAFPDDSLMPESLTRLISEILRESPGNFDADHSLSYPAWLTKLQPYRNPAVEQG